MKLEDGLYAVKNGKITKIDLFTWGYEGLAKTEHSAIVGYNGKNVLVSGPGMNEMEIVVDFRE